MAVGHGSGRRLGEHEDLGRNARRGESAGLVAVHSRHQRQRQARRLCRAEPARRSREGSAHRSGRRRALCGDAASERRQHLVRRGRVRRARGLRALRSEDRADGSLQRADAGVRHARRRHRQERRAVGLGVERPSRQLRSPQVQGAAERSERHRQPLPRRLGEVSVPRSGFRRLGREQRRVRAITPGSTSTTWSGSARTFRYRRRI